MVQYHARSLRKKSGGLRRYSHKKKLHELGGDWVETKVGDERRMVYIIRGGSLKSKLFATKIANVTDPNTKKTAKTEIAGVVSNAANPHYVRRGLITKGTIIKTGLGNARVTSSPGQDGVINAILVKE